MQCKWLHILCLCAAIQIQFIGGHPNGNSPDADTGSGSQAAEHGATHKTHHTTPNGSFLQRTNDSPTNYGNSQNHQPTNGIQQNNGNVQQHPQANGAQANNGNGQYPSSTSGTHQDNGLNYETTTYTSSQQRETKKYNNNRQGHQPTSGAHQDNRNGQYHQQTNDAQTYNRNGQPHQQSYGAQTYNGNGQPHQQSNGQFQPSTSGTHQANGYGQYPSSISGTHQANGNGQPHQQSNGQFRPSTSGTHQDNGSNNPRHICTISTINYDCQFRGVHLKNGEIYDFGLEHNDQKILTFQDSTLEYLPKSLVDAFPLVTLLNLNNLMITSIDQKAFEKAIYLESLFIENNRLIKIDRFAFSGAKNLRVLVLSKNEIITIDQYSFASNTGLQELYLEQNQLNALPEFKNTRNLQFLNTSHNNLVSIDDTHFSGLRYLKTLDVSFNRLQRLNLREITANLDLVDVSSNGLTDFIMPPHVTHLKARNNSLTEFEMGQQCTVKTIDLSWNKLETQPMLKTCTSLEYLDLSNNLLETFHFNLTTANLQYLCLAHNNLFEIHLPIKTPPRPLSLRILDLSHNRLSQGPSVTEFKKLEWVYLNDNHLISSKSYVDRSHKNFQGYLMANNEWSCAEIAKFIHLTQDKSPNHCAKEMMKVDGICCRNYAKPYNDRLNEISRDAVFHERSNQKHCSKSLPTISSQMTNIDEFRKAISSANAENAEVIRNIQNASERKNGLQNSLEKSKNLRARLDRSKSDVTREIEKQRKFYRVTKEGLIPEKEMLERIIKFVQEKDEFNKDLLMRRQQDTEESSRMFTEKQQEIEELNQTISHLQRTQTALKKEEKDKKKMKDQLEKDLNKNAASIHGSSGRISQ